MGRAWSSTAATTAAAIAGFLALSLHPAAATTGSPADIDGDGYAELAIGVPEAEVNTRAGAGMISILPGSATGPAEVSNLTLSQNSTLGGVAIPGSAEAGDAFGAATAWGDLNGDGYADLAVAAPGEDDTSGHTDNGAITVLHGSATGFTPYPNHRLHPASARVNGERCGQALTAGDFTGDGNDDLLMFCPGSYTLWWIDGATLEVHSTDTQQVAARTTGSGATRPALASGDFDQDGYTDAALTFTQPDGTTPLYLLPGSADGITTATLTTLESNLGATALATGDLNGDGVTDLAAGRPDSGPGGTVSAYYGAPGNGLDPARSHYIHQDSSGVPGAGSTGEELGYSLAVADITGDGYDDVIAGSPGEDHTSGAIDGGRTVIIPGSATGITGSGSIAYHADTTGIGGVPETGDRWGTATTAADHNGDGIGDFAVGSSGENTGDGTAISLNTTATGIDPATSNYHGPGALDIPNGSHIGNVLGH